MAFMKLFLTATLLTSSGMAANVAGHYVLSGVMEVGSELLLKPDGTFEYMLAYGAADYSAKGSWRVEGDAVVLTSAAVQGVPLRLVQSGAGKADGFRVAVKTAGGAPVPHIEVGLMTGKDPQVKRTDDTGAAFFGPVRGDKSIALRVLVYDVEAGPFAIDAAHNEVVFEIDGNAITHVPFKAERLRIDGTTLEMRYGTKRKRCAIRDPGKVRNVGQRLTLPAREEARRA
jgi:hypothetical protein